ncbi:VOC family protein [Halobacillus salinus]|uniref:VOC family protein n=1 Tax=Halobacillus salinus TaxID=192814 RepID=UPI0009A83372|nr:VOC family protein [Halobacillus salinus]
MENSIQSLTVLYVSDLNRSSHFYQAVYGCEVTDWWALRNDDIKLGFKLIQSDPASWVAPKPGLSHAYGYTEDIESLNRLFEEWKEKGVGVVQEPQSMQMNWGTWREFYVKDPDGYVLGMGSAEHN